MKFWRRTGVLVRYRGRGQCGWTRLRGDRVNSSGRVAHFPFCRSLNREFHRCDRISYFTARRIHKCGANRRRTLSKEYKEKRLIAAEYRDGKKVKGINDWKDARRRLKMCFDYFGKKRIRKITYADIENFRNNLLATPVVIKKRDDTVVSSRERSIADVNRIRQSPQGDIRFILRAEEIRQGYSCLHSADGFFLALNEDLAKSGPAEF
jgi:hypothetical protein